MLHFAKKLDCKRTIQNFVCHSITNGGHVICHATLRTFFCHVYGLIALKEHKMDINKESAKVEDNA